MILECSTNLQNISDDGSAVGRPKNNALAKSEEANVTANFQLHHVSITQLGSFREAKLNPVFCLITGERF